jgi:hypothetical protein
VPISAELSQWAAVASQNVTVPAVTGEPLDNTPAVNVTTVPEVTDEDDNVSVVVVAGGTACAVGATSNAVIAVSAAKKIRAQSFSLVEEFTACMGGASRARNSERQTPRTHLRLKGEEKLSIGQNSREDYFLNTVHVARATLAGRTVPMFTANTAVRKVLSYCFL